MLFVVVGFVVVVYRKDISR